MKNSKGIFAHYFDDEGKFTWEVVDQVRRERSFDERLTDELLSNPARVVLSDHGVKH